MAENNHLYHSPSRLRAIKYKNAHAAYVSRRSCVLVRVRDPWRELRAKGPLIAPIPARHGSEHFDSAGPNSSSRNAEEWAVLEDLALRRRSSVAAASAAATAAAAVTASAAAAADALGKLAEEDEDEESPETMAKRKGKKPTEAAATPAKRRTSFGWPASPVVPPIALSSLHFDQPTSPTTHEEDNDAVFMTRPPQEQQQDDDDELGDENDSFGSRSRTPTPPVPDIDLDRYLAEHRVPPDPAWSRPIPTGIMAATRALRTALLRPTHYWSVASIAPPPRAHAFVDAAAGEPAAPNDVTAGERADPHHTQGTQASRARTRIPWKRVEVDRVLGPAVPNAAYAADDMGTSSRDILMGMMGGGDEKAAKTAEEDEDDELAAALRSDPGLRSPAHSEWSDAGADAPSTRVLGMLARPNAPGTRSGVGAAMVAPGAGRRAPGMGTTGSNNTGGALGGALGRVAAMAHKRARADAAAAASGMSGGGVTGGSGLGGGGAGGDGMDHVRALMRKVHYKLQLLEAELARVAAEEAKRRRERELTHRAAGSRAFLGSRLAGSKLSFFGGPGQGSRMLGAGASKMSLAGGSMAGLGGGGGGGSSSLGSGVGLAALPSGGARYRAGLAMGSHDGSAGAALGAAPPPPPRKPSNLSVSILGASQPAPSSG
ncbi:hypothetical protein BC828DRAFT_389775 [Blastocladiella britannica]|nr:hypothetical protein BC828DRAFT_389775 [Blastocladiella britannica]